MFIQLMIYSQAIYNLGEGSCFLGFINGTLNASYYLMMLDQQKFYSGHKRKYEYKYQAIVILDSFVVSLIRPFISRKGDWAMVKQSSLAKKLRAFNKSWQPAHTFSLYGVLIYSTLYKIIYLSRSHTLTQNQSSKIMSRLKIKVDHGFAIYQNLWI